MCFSRCLKSVLAAVCVAAPLGCAPLSQITTAKSVLIDRPVSGSPIREDGDRTQSQSARTQNSSGEHHERSDETIQTVAHRSDPALPPLPEPAGEPEAAAEQPPDEQPPAELPALHDESESRGITLAELESLALENNPTVQQALAVVEAERGRWVQVGLCPNPNVGYTSQEMGNLEDERGQQGGYLQQTIVTAHKLELNRAVATQEVQRALWQLEAQQGRILNDVRIRYYRALGAQRQTALAKQLQAIAEQGVVLSQRLFDAQQVSRADVLESEVQLNQVQVLVRDAEYREAAARQQLANVVGVPDLERSRVAGDLEDDQPFIDRETAWRQVLDASPELQAAHARVARARAQTRRAEVEPIPNVDFQGMVQHDTPSDTTFFAAQVTVPLPVFDWNQGNVRAAVAEQRQAIANVRRLELVLRDRLATANQRYLAAANEVERYRQDVLPKAQEALDLVEAGYQAEEFSVIRLLSARRTYFETSVDYVTALTELRMSAVELDGLLLRGGLDDPAQAATAENEASYIVEP